MRYYPKKYYVRKVIKEFLSSSAIRDYCKVRGILPIANKKEDFANIGGDFYLSKSDYVLLRNNLDSDHNYEKSGRIMVKTESVVELESAIEQLNGKCIDESDNTKVTVTRDEQQNLKMSIEYTEFKPGMIDLLDQTPRRVEVKLNKDDQHPTLDFNHKSSSEYKKVKDVFQQIISKNEDIDFNLTEMKINDLSKDNRLALFDQFFEIGHQPWDIVEITKLKLKRDDKTRVMTEDQLKGINSALLDGENLRQNQFVKNTISEGFYFSMATMRFEHETKPEYFEFSIEFKFRPEICETKIINSGIIEQNEDGENVDVRNVMHKDDQRSLLFDLINKLNEIYNDLKQKEEGNYPEIEVAATNE